MLFRSRNRQITYTVKRQYKVAENGVERITHGLRAKFIGSGLGSGSTWDSELEQKNLGWTDDDRETVETYLQGHGDFGKSLYLIDEKAVLEGILNPKTCLAMYVFQGDSHTCGRPCEGDFCIEHSSEYADEEEDSIFA